MLDTLRPLPQARLSDPRPGPPTGAPQLVKKAAEWHREKRPELPSSPGSLAHVQVGLPVGFTYFSWTQVAWESGDVAAHTLAGSEHRAQGHLGYGPRTQPRNPVCWRSPCFLCLVTTPALSTEHSSPGNNCPVSNQGS